MIQQPARIGRQAARARQRGAVLMVSLLMLLVMTMVGVTAMSTVNLEEKMAANSMHRNRAFQASESAVEGAIADVNNFTQTINNDPTPVTVTVNLNDSNVTSVAQMSFLGQGAAPGYSVGEGQGNFVAYRFSVNGTGSVPAVNAQTVTAEGVFRVAPGGS